MITTMLFHPNHHMETLDESALMSKVLCMAFLGILFFCLLRVRTSQ